MLEIIITVLLIGMLVSLVSSLAFLFKDVERPGARRVLRSLGLRITLAAALLATVFYGFATGELEIGRSAPWHDRAPTETVD